MDSTGCAGNSPLMAVARSIYVIQHPESELKGVCETGNVTNMVEEPVSSLSTVVSDSADMEIDEAYLPQGALENVVDAAQKKVFDSIPVILHRTLKAEHNNLTRTSDFLILAVHAVMLETGFIVLKAAEEGRSLPCGWLNGGMANICYTLRDTSKMGNCINSVVLKSLTLGGNVVICGTITGSGLPAWKLLLPTSKHLVGTAIARDDLLSAFLDISELWKCAKDELSMPLLTALCERAGLPPPSSLLALPTELKMKILECLPALDLVKAGCTCSELRHLCAKNELWKELFCHDFGNSSAKQQLPSFLGWKTVYADRFRKKKRMLERRSCHVYRPCSRIIPRSRFPNIIGGEYQIYPSFGGGPFRSGFFGAGRGPLAGLRRR